MGQDETYKWIQDRLRDLHSGTLSEADHARLTEIGQTDPFVHDALEGYKAHADHDHSVLLKVLAQRIENKVAKRHPKILPLSRGILLQAVAASFVIILATWAVIYYMSKDDQIETFATQTDTIIMTDSVVELPGTTYNETSEDMAVAETAVEEKASDESGLRANAQSRAKDYLSKQESDADKKESISNDESTIATSGEQYGTDLQAEPAVVVESAPAPAAAFEKDVAADQRKSDYEAGSGVTSKTLSNRDEGAYANAMRPDMMAMRVTGQVLDVNIEPIIGASVNVSSTTLTASTDLYGRFELFIPKDQAVLEASQPGYENTSITANQGQEDLVILLNAGQPIPPAAAETNAAQKQQYVQNRAQLQNTSSFVNYIFTYSQIPIATVYSPSVKEVKLEFRVDSKGQPERIKVVKSSGEKKYEEEAIQLVKDGPNWVCGDGVYPCVKEFTFFFE